MAKVVLEPIGDPRERFLPDAIAHAQGAQMRALVQALAAQRAAVRAGWGPRYESRVREKGKWDPLESTCRHASLSIL